jgi:ABC-type oligopeptide transport system substrate-binding subunit
MTETLNYEEFRKLFDSLGRPGCPSFPESYSNGPVCYNFKPALLRAKKPEARLRFVINQSGGDDLKRGAEWFQNQWKKALNLETNIESIEGKVLLSEIRSATPDIFRLGVPLTRPTCLAALELFKSDSASNYVHIIDKELDRLIMKLEDADSSKQKKIFCRQALTRLLDLHALIPLGRFQFFMVLSEKFNGIEINELNHLNLSQLHPTHVSK